MGFIGEEEQKGVVTSGEIRGIFSEFLSFDFHKIIDGHFGNQWAISRCLALSVLFWGLFSVLWQMVPSLPLFAFGWALGTAPIWMPVAALILAWKVWVWYSHAGYIFTRDSVLFEL
ncbi:MAG: hypothetical protein Q7R90_04770 [bacterium]|nr:hypothetical protein [bacterium]